MINFLEPNIVIIDDVQKEIEGIHNYYIEKGIGCKVFNPDLFDGDDFPTTPFSDVGIIYLDLYYSGEFNAERCASWIRHLVKPKSFYILIMWTNDVNKSEEVEELLAKQNVTPFLSLTKSKTNFNTKDGYNYAGLFEEINAEINSTAALEEILIWKKAIKFSANQIIGHLTKTPSIITNKLKKIILSHGGLSVKESEDKNKRNILFDALDAVLISNTRNNIEADISELNTKEVYDLKDIEKEEVDKELNSWFHFKLDKDIPDGIIYPGLIAVNNHKLFRKIYSITDDPKLESLFKVQNQENVQVQDIVLVLSRPCDIAQKKYGKNIKLLSGVLINKAYRNTKGKEKGQIDFNGQKLPDSIKQFDHLYFDANYDDIALLFDYRSVFSVPENIFVQKFKNIQIFNKELLSEIQVGYSSYSSRLGITQII